MIPEQRRPLIFDIHRHALDDGPGIRTTVFTKGCPLTCIWCHNPEGIQSAPELYFLELQCISCGDCIEACPHGALSLKKTLQMNRQRCNGCGNCTQVCPSSALTVKGCYYPEQTLVELLLKDKIFYDTSNGGVTFSGGEPCIHPQYLGRVMRNLKAHDIHIAIQTCGLFEWKAFQNHLLPWIDLIYFDIKYLDTERHRQMTGRRNHLILANLERLIKVVHNKVICSIPLVNGFTTDMPNLHAVARHISAINGLTYCLHPYHPGAHSKAAALGQTVAETLPAQALPAIEYQAIAAVFDTIFNHDRHAKSDNKETGAPPMKSTLNPADAADIIG